MSRLSALAIIAAMTAPQLAHANPNILLIIADDMGLDASLCYKVGTQQAPMPNIERMCDEGLVFDNAYADPTCSPTRATIMTGQYGLRTGVGGAIPRQGGNGLSADATSLFDVLGPTGYSTNLIGKWHLSGVGTDFNHPADLGVSDYFGLFKGATPDYFNWTAVENGAEVQIEGYATTVFTDRAIDWIAEQQSPWFLWLAYNAPHAPFHLPPADLHSFTDLADDEDTIADNPLPYYNAMLEALDTEVGRLLTSMPADVRDNTVVMFIGDNGSPNQVARNIYPIHGAKGAIYEGGTHIPFVMQGPGITPGRADGFANTTDIFATVAGLAGANIPSGTDAYDLAPALSGGSTERDYIYVEHFSEDEARRGNVYGWALRQDQYKLVTPEGEPSQLYDLASDPTEQSDLAADGLDAEKQAVFDQLMEMKNSLQPD